MMERCRWLYGMLTSLLFVSVSLASDPVNRKSDTAEADLIAALLQRQQIALAAEICRSHLEETQLDDDVHASWLIQAALVDNAWTLQQEPSKAAATAEAIPKLTPPLNSSVRIDQFLVSNPDYPQRAWLQFQLRLNELSIITSDILAALVSSTASSPADKETLLERIARVQSQLQDLATEVNAQVDLARSKPQAAAESEDLIRLVYLIAEKRLSTILLQGELFEPGSPDYIATATAAHSAAKRSLDGLSGSVATRIRFLKLNAEALRRLARLDEAMTAIEAALTINRLDGEAIAIAIRIDLDRQRLSQARARAQSFQAEGAEGELEFRLAMLELTIAAANNTTEDLDQQSLSQQVQLIRDRFGAYAKRRAQRIVLDVLPPESGNVTDPQLLLARAGQWLREGKAAQAVDELLAAARTATEPQAATTLGTAAAAIQRQQQDFAAAADTLREISLAHIGFSESPKLHYQAALVMREHWSPAALSEHLQEFIAQWPSDALARDAARWLEKIYVAQNNEQAAAQALTTIGVAQSDQTLALSGYQHWIKALADSDVSERSRLTLEALTLYQQDSSGRPQTPAFHLALLGLPITQVQPLVNASLSSQSLARWVGWLARVRGLAGLPEELLASIDKPFDQAATLERSLAVERLLADGRENAAARSRIGNAIIALSQTDEIEDVVMIQAYDWVGDYRSLQQRVPSDLDPGDALTIRIADILDDSSDPQSLQLALQLWGRVSGHARLGSPLWHQAKLATLEILRATQQSAQAGRLAEYVLLTQPPENEEQLARYRAFLQSPSTKTP